MNLELFQGDDMDPFWIKSGVVLVITFWFCTGLFVLKVDRVAAVDVLGKLWKIWGPGGLGWAPAGISEVHRYTIRLQDFTLRLPPVTMGSTKHSLYLNDNNEPVKLRGLSLEEQRDIMEDPLHRQFSLEIEATIFFSLGREDLFSLIRRVGSIDELKKKLMEMSRIALHDKLGRITVGTLLAHRQVVSLLFDERLKEIAGTWDLPVSMATIGALTLPPEIEQSQRDVAQAFAEKHAMIARGEGRAGAIKPFQELMETETGKAAALLVEGSEALKGGNVQVIVAPELMGALAGMRKIFQM